MDDDQDRELIAAARDALGAAYVPYSAHPVGAALRTADGTVFTGCNVENANFSNSLHAEEVAVGGAVAAGHRRFEALAVVGETDGLLPCGACRQTLAEFCGAGFPVIAEGGEGGATTTHRLGDLLPDAIGPADLGVDADAG